jgi:hypothetical protein
VSCSNINGYLRNYQDCLTLGPLVLGGVAGHAQTVSQYVSTFGKGLVKLLYIFFGINVNKCHELSFWLGIVDNVNF